MSGIKHNFHACDSERCHICAGGLALCTVCRAAEGELLSSCPGYELNPEALGACYSGNVMDIEDYKSSVRYQERQERRRE